MAKMSRFGPQEEAKHINQSLHSLSGVVQKLSGQSAAGRRGSHVPLSLIHI